jgi:hypothetical protein
VVINMCDGYALFQALLVEKKSVKNHLKVTR